MRRTILAAAAVLIALLLQLTAVNGLRLPGGGVPDLVLLVVIALGLAGGPVAGAVTGFAAGLALDLAPPGSAAIGQYALVFCLVGWACGRFRGTLGRSALLPVTIAAAAAVTGELMVAALGLGLQPEQVSWTSVHQVLPVTLLYDVVVSPFVLYVILLASAWLTDEAGAPEFGPSRARGGPASGPLPGRTGLGGAAGLGAAGSSVLLGPGGWLSGPAQGRGARRAAARLRPGGRPGDGWLGDAGARGGLGGVDSPSFRIRAAGGRAMRGQAFSGATISRITRGGPGLPGGSPSGRIFTGRAPRRGGLSRSSRSALGRAAAGRGGLGRSAFGRGGSGGGLSGSAVARLRAGSPAGPAASGQAPRTLPASSVNLRLSGGGRRRGSARAGGHGSVVVGRAMSRASLARLGRRRTRGAGFRPAIMPGGSAVPRPRSPGRVSLASAAPVRFGTRRRGGLIGGGALTQASRARTRAASPKLRLQAGLPGPALTSAGGRPATPRFRSRPLAGRRPQTGRRPRFRSRPWSVLALLTRRHGGLLAPRRVRGAVPGYRRAGARHGSRKRTGGPQ
jgi:rod shape-determining protein MreD